MLRKILISNSAFVNSRHKSSQLRSFFSSSQVYDAKQDEERLSLISKIYSPLTKAIDIKKWNERFKSGKVWENYFRPFEWREQDYDFQEKHINILNEIDVLKRFTKTSSVDLLKHMNMSLTQQSCFLEGNTLEFAEVQQIWYSLKENHILENLLENSELELPPPCSLSNKSEHEVIEVRNHLLANYLLYSNFYKLKHEINIDEMKRIHRILLKDTSREEVGSRDGRIQYAGELRLDEVGARGFHLTVYPFALEVPALMDRFFQFRDELVRYPTFHPLMIACRILSAFLHIHPFIDGNGRLGRLMMALYLIRHDYPPIYLQQISRLEYNLALFSLQTSKEPDSLYRMIIESSFNCLMNNQKTDFDRSPPEDQNANHQKNQA